MGSNQSTLVFLDRALASACSKKCKVKFSSVCVCARVCMRGSRCTEKVVRRNATAKTKTTSKISALQDRLRVG